MYSKQVKQINKDIAKKGRAIVAIGCSFVQGQGAINDEIFDEYEFLANEGEVLKIDATLAEKKYLEQRYENLTIGPDGVLDFTFMEYENSFVYQLANHNFKGKYVPINFGQRGCGNRASIKELYFNNINWKHCREIIVIYCPSGIERFDFAQDQSSEHFRWTCMWPNELNEDTPRSRLWNGYRDAVYSDKHAIIEQIGHVQELLTWCKAHNAKLIITPGFDRRYDREYFEHELSMHVERHGGFNLGEYRKKRILESKNLFVDYYIDLWPWENMFFPFEFKTFADMAIAQEPNITDKKDTYWQFIGKRSPLGYMTSCAHPGQKAHALFASALASHIKKTLHAS
jgi:hypothetical protein